MARPDESVSEVLHTLQDSPLRGIAAAAATAVADLPDLPQDTAELRIGAAEEQLGAVRLAVAPGLKRELEALARLPELASQLGLSPEVLVADDVHVAPTSLTDGRRAGAIKGFLDVFDEALRDAERQVRLREGLLP
jgi:hypothetical protein